MLVSSTSIIIFINHISMVFCQKGPTRHAYVWQIGPFWQDTLNMMRMYIVLHKKVVWSIPCFITYRGADYFRWTKFTSMK